MKMFKVLVAASFLFASSAYAFQFNNPTSSSNIRVVVNNGVATVSGNVESYFDRILVEREIKKNPTVTSVRNLLLISRSRG